MNITLPYTEWQGLLEQREKLKATIAQKDAEIERLREAIREMMNNLFGLEFDQTAYNIGEKALEVNDE